MSLPFLSLKPGDHALGLDIGSHAIKLVEVKRHGHQFEITRFAHRVVPFEAQENDQEIAAIIQSLFDEQNIKARQVYLAVSGQNVVIRRAALPKMPEEELVEAIKWDARDEILFDLEVASVDFHITGETTQAGGVYNELLTVIAEGEFIQRQVNLVQAAGLKLLGITAFPVALWDYDLARAEVKPGEVTCFIDMGAERTRVYFASEKDLLFFREIPNGGQNVTEALASSFELENGQRLALDEDRAEEIKIEYGFPPENATGTTPEGIPLAEISDRLLPVLNKQAEEIYRSIEYFKNLFKNDEISRITVSGGAGGLKGFYQFLSEMLELQIEPSNPLLQSSPPVSGVSETEAGVIGPSLTGATGLAVGQCDKINLLPEHLRPSLKKRLVKLAWAAVIPLIIGGFFLVSMTLREQVKTLEDGLLESQQRLTAFQQTIASLDGPKRELSSLKLRRQELQSELSQMPVGSEAAVNFPEFFRYLASNFPENGSLEKVNFTTNDEQAENARDRRILLQGNIFGEEGDSLKAVENLLQSLNRSSHVAEAKLLNTKKMDGSQFTRTGLSFSLVVRVLEDNQVPL